MKKLIAALVVAGAMIAPLCLNNAASASTYNTNTKDCSVKLKGSTNDAGNDSSRFADMHDGFIRFAVVVSGDKDCTKNISVASWRAPYGSFNTLPVSKQTLYASHSYKFDVGTHVITIAVPDCMFQVDVVYGSNPTYKGTAAYPSDMKLGWLISGEGVCVDKNATAPAATPTPTPAPVVTQAPVVAAPAPAPVAAPAAVQAAPTKATELPATGAASTIAAFGLASIAGTLGFRAYLRRRQSI